MRIAVCEDNSADRAFICTYIKRYCTRYAYGCELAEFETGEALLEAMDTGDFQVILMDIYLPGMTGMDTARKIRERNHACAIMFITVSTEHALEGFGVAAATYVVKPLQEDKLEKALTVCQSIFERNSRVLEIPMNGENLALPFSGIRYAEVYGKNTLFHMLNGTVEARIPLESVEQSLGGFPFLRCHRSYIVNMNHVNTVNERELHLSGGESVPIRKNGGKAVRLAYARFLCGAAEE